MDSLSALCYRKNMLSIMRKWRPDAIMHCAVIDLKGNRGYFLLPVEGAVIHMYTQGATPSVDQQKNAPLIPWRASDYTGIRFTEALNQLCLFYAVESSGIPHTWFYHALTSMPCVKH